MAREVSFNAVAREQFLQIGLWYASISTQLATRFSADVERVLNLIQTYPEMYALIYRDLRRGALKSFPYHLYYRTNSDLIEVVAILHHSRDQGEFSGAD